jgi:hypothetical protein
MADGLSISPTSSVRVFDCPVCAETIDTSSVKCRFCGSTIDSDQAERAAARTSRVAEALSEADDGWMPMWVPAVGAICDFAFLMSIVARIGSSDAMDMGQMSSLAAICLLLALIVGVAGVIGFFTGGGKRAAVAALTGLGPCALVFFLIAF